MGGTYNHRPSKFEQGFKLHIKPQEIFHEFLLDGRIPLSNNLSEIAVKPVAITRKNSLFSDSVEGAKASAIIFSIIGTAAANNLDAYKYLEYIFWQLPNLTFVEDDPIMGEYLPWSEKVQHECKIKSTGTNDEERAELCCETA